MDLNNSIEILEESLPVDEKDKIYYNAVKEIVNNSFTDEHCIRLCRSFRNEKKNRMIKTIELTKKIKIWREEFNVDNIINKPIEKSQVFYEYWPSYLYGEDPYGHIINMERFIDINIEKLQTNFDIKLILIHRMKHMERLQAEKAAISKRIGRRIYKHIFIFDLTGISFKHSTSSVMQTIKPIFDLGQIYYPESLYRMYLVNAPTIFYTIWKIISAIIDPETKEKIHVYKNNIQFLEHIKKIGIKLDAIPVTLGGTNKGKLIDDTFKISESNSTVDISNLIASKNILEIKETNSNDHLMNKHIDIHL